MRAATSIRSWRGLRRADGRRADEAVGVRARGIRLGRQNFGEAPRTEVTTGIEVGMICEGASITPLSGFSGVLEGVSVVLESKLLARRELGRWEFWLGRRGRKGTTKAPRVLGLHHI
jgi:hypothetical protein